jgi:hypothetical protein
MKPFLKWVDGKKDLVEHLGIPDEITARRAIHSRDPSSTAKECIISNIFKE